MSGMTKRFHTIQSTIRNLKKDLPDSFIQNIKGEGYIVNNI